MIAFYENNKMPLRSFQSVDLNFSAHLHKETELLFMQEGQVLVTVNGVQYTASPGDMLILFPNTVHSYLSKENTKGIMIIFSSELAGEFNYKLTHYSCPVPLLYRNQVHRDIPYCMESILNTDVQPGNHSLIRGYLLILLSRVFSDLELCPLQQEEDFDLIHRILLYVTENFKEKISLEKVSKELGVSRFYLSRTFSKKVGCGLGKYINSLRIGFAQHLLENQKLSISEIAFECGFDSLRTFNRVFREHLNQTPREYREQLKGL